MDFDDLKDMKWFEKPFLRIPIANETIAATNKIILIVSLKVSKSRNYTFLVVFS